MEGTHRDPASAKLLDLDAIGECVLDVIRNAALLALPELVTEDDFERGRVDLGRTEDAVARLQGKSPLA